MIELSADSLWSELMMAITIAMPPRDPEDEDEEEDDDDDDGEEEEPPVIREPDADC